MCLIDQVFVKKRVAFKFQKELREFEIIEVLSTFMKINFRSLSILGSEPGISRLFSFIFPHFTAKLQWVPWFLKLFIPQQSKLKRLSLASFSWLFIICRLTHKYWIGLKLDKHASLFYCDDRDEEEKLLIIDFSSTSWRSPSPSTHLSTSSWPASSSDSTEWIRRSGKQEVQIVFNKTLSLNNKCLS
jgi:hypothetical protein